MIFSPARLSRIKFMVLFLDLWVLLASFVMIYFWRVGGTASEVIFDPAVWILSLLVLSNLYIFGSYDLTSEDHKAWQIGKNFLALMASFSIATIIVFFMRAEIRGVLGRGVLAGALLSFLVVSSFYKLVLNNYFLSLKGKSRWLVLAQNLNESLMRHLLKDFQSGVLGHQIEVCSRRDDFNQKLTEVWSGIIIASDETFELTESRRLMQLKLRGQLVADVVQIYEKYWRKIPVFYIGDRWLLFSEGFQLTHNPIGLRIKRLFDIGAALIMLIVSSPIMLIAAIAIKLDSPGPALFSQTRTGKDGKDFTIYKFRSMRTDAEKNGAQWATQNDSRVTRLGSFLRKTRIDELPQLYNVLKGDMSFIGPRPERPEFNEKLEKEIPYYSMRHLVRPGLSGWAQVNYPYGASVEDAIEKLQYELYYIKNYSILLDLKIVLKTVQVVLFGKGR